MTDYKADNTDAIENLFQQKRQQSLKETFDKLLPYSTKLRSLQSTINTMENSLPSDERATQSVIDLANLIHDFIIPQSDNLSLNKDGDTNILARGTPGNYQLRIESALSNLVSHVVRLEAIAEAKKTEEDTNKSLQSSSSPKRPSWSSGQSPERGLPSKTTLRATGSSTFNDSDILNASEEEVVSS